MFSAAGDRILTASVDKSIRLWLIRPHDLLKLADELILRDFTRNEREQYAELLRERPVEACVDPSFEEVADGEAQRLFRRAFDRFIQAKLDEMPAGLRRGLNRLAVERPFLGETPLERLRRAAWGLVEWRDFPASWGRRPSP